MSLNRGIIAVALAFVAVPAVSAHAVLVASYVDGTLAEGAALAELTNSPLVIASDLSNVGFQDDPLITRDEFAGPTPAGPNAGSAAGSEWLFMRANQVGPTAISTDDYFGFTITALDRLFLDDLTFDHVLARDGRNNGGINGNYNLFAQINGIGGFVSLGTGAAVGIGEIVDFGPVTTQFVDLSSIVLAPGDSIEFRLAFSDNSGVSGKGSFVQGIQLQAHAVPEPASIALLAMSGAGLLRRRRLA